MEGREDVARVWRGLEMKMRRSRSHVPHPPHLMEPSSMEPFVNLLAELQRHCDFAAIVSGHVWTCLDMFGHVTCSPPQLGLTNSGCFAQRQLKI